MLCQNCGKREVNFKYTQVINGVKKEMALCNQCAKEMGIDSVGNIEFNMPINFSSFLGDFLNEYEDMNFLPTFAKPEILKCPNCQMTYEEFSNTGKFKCSKCYEIFAEKINPLLKNIHGSSKHIGRVYKKLGAEGEKIEEIEKEKPNINTKNNKEKEENSEKQKLEKELKKAIQEERYEDAAKIRDKIKKSDK